MQVAGETPGSGEEETKGALRREMPQACFVLFHDESKSRTISLLQTERWAGGDAVYTRLHNSKAEKIRRV